MGQSKAASAQRRRLRTGTGAAWQGSSPARSVLCVLPKRLPANPLKPLLQGYDLAAAECWTAVRGLARHKAYDLYVIHSPLEWADPMQICGRIQAFDTHTPVILYSVCPSAGERRETLGGGCIQAYVARSDDVNNLPGTAGQLIIISELRSHEAMRTGVQTMQDHIARRLGRLDRGSGASDEARRVHAQARLKSEACRMFTAAGGSRANFERAWPSIFEGAMKRAGRAGS